MAKQNNSNNFSGRSTSTTTVASNTTANNTSTPATSYYGNLHTRDLAFPVYLDNPPMIIVRGGESSRRVYTGWYHILNTGEYRTGKIPKNNVRVSLNVVKSSVRPDNGKTGTYDYFLDDPSKGYLEVKSDVVLTFEDQQEILDSGYNGEAGAQKPAHINYIMGNMVRYFARKRNTQFYQEINSTQYDNIGENNNVWDRRTIPWIISSTVQEIAISRNKTNVWLVEAGGLTQTTVQSQPDPNSPSPFVNPKKPIFSYTGPTEFTSDGSPYEGFFGRGTSTYRQYNSISTGTGRSIALSRAKQSIISLTGATSLQGNGNPWPKFMDWFKSHESRLSYPDAFISIDPYAIFINPSNELSSNLFYQSCSWLLRSEDYRTFSKYFVCTPDGGIPPNCNAISTNGNLNSGQFYDKTTPNYNPDKPLTNRVNLKNGSSYNPTIPPPSNNSFLKKDKLFNTIYEEFNSYSLFLKAYNLTTLIEASNGLPYSVYNRIAKSANTDIINYIPKPFSIPSPSFQISGKDSNGNFTTTNLLGGNAFPTLFDTDFNYRGFVPSTLTIYQYTGIDRPGGGTYDNYYYTLPKIGVSLFKADGTPRNYKYKGPIFEVYKDCQAAFKYKTTIFSGNKPDIPLLPGTGKNRTDRFSNKPLFNENYFKNYLLENFPEAVKYFAEVGISLSL